MTVTDGEAGALELYRREEQRSNVMMKANAELRKQLSAVEVTLDEMRQRLKLEQQRSLGLVTALKKDEAEIRELKGKILQLELEVGGGAM